MRWHVPVCSAVEVVVLVVSAGSSCFGTQFHACFVLPPRLHGTCHCVIVFAVFSCLAVLAPSQLDSRSPAS